MINATTWTNLSQNMILSKQSLTQNKTYCIIALIWSSKTGIINLWEINQIMVISWGVRGDWLERGMRQHLMMWINPWKHLSKSNEYVPKIYVEIPSVLCFHYTFIFQGYFIVSEHQVKPIFSITFWNNLSIKYKSYESLS